MHKVISIKLQGNLQRLKAIKKLYWIKFHRDTVPIRNKTFSFKGRINTPVKGYLRFEKESTPGSDEDKNRERLIFYFGAEDVIIWVRDSLKNAVVKHSKINKDYNEYQSAISSAMDSLNAVSSALRHMNPKQIADTSYRNSLEIRNKRAKTIKRKLHWEYIHQHPDSYFSLLALKQLTYAFHDVAVLTKDFNLISERLRNSHTGKEYAQFIQAQKNLVVGAYAPDFTLKDTAGISVSLSDFRGEYVLVDFWSSWCGPCRKENPNVVKMYKKYHNAGFMVLSVSQDAASWKSLGCMLFVKTI